MVVLILATVIVAGFVYKRFTKRRARKRASRAVAVDHPGNATNREDESFPDEVIITGESNPPPYPTSTAQSAESSEDLFHLELEYSETYVRDKPPPYITTVLQVQNP